MKASNRAKSMRCLLIAMLTVIATALLPTVEVNATHGFGSGETLVIVDGVPFYIWTYGGRGGDGFAHIRLRDMAYVLNGTTAQFDIRDIADDRLDFWIMRGEAFNADGTELEPIPMRYLMFGSYGFFGWHGDDFDIYPTQTAVVGFDGSDSPERIMPAQILRDIDDMFLPLHTMADWFGFSITSGRHAERYHFYEIRTDANPPQEIPAHSIEFIDLMIRFAGHWIDAAYYYSPIIDESVLAPMYFALSIHGFSDEATKFINDATLNWAGEWFVPQWHSVSVQNLENGFVELTIDVSDSTARFQNYRIIADASNRHIDEITLYINDVSYTMLRYERSYSINDFLIEEADSGGVKVRYLLWQRDLSATIIDDFRLYRSTVLDIRGDIQIPIVPIDVFNNAQHFNFKFIDRDIESGQVYYYSLWRVTDRGLARVSIFFGEREQQIVVDTNEVLSTSEEEVPEIFDIEPSQTTMTNRIWIALLPISIVIAVIFRMLFNKTTKGL